MPVPLEAVPIAMLLGIALGRCLRVERWKITVERRDERIAYLTGELAAAERDLRAQQSRVPWGYRRPRGLVTSRPARPHYVANPRRRPPTPTATELAEWAMELDGLPWWSSANGRLMEVIEEGDATPRLAPSEPPSTARLRRLAA